MDTPAAFTDERWTLLVDRHFHDFEEFAERIRGWDLDFRQLRAGRSPSDLLQFGSRDCMVTRFGMSQPYDQRGGTPPNSLTIGFLEEGADSVRTPGGIITEDELWCFSAGREFACATRSDFRAWSLSLSVCLLDEVAETCEMSVARSTVGSARIVRSHRRANSNEVRRQLVALSRGIRNNETALSYQTRAHELELDLARRMLVVLAGPQNELRPPMTIRRRSILGRALEYLDANPRSPITVYELAQVAGASLRTLEYLFREHFGVTPKAFLASRRLVGARRQLQQADAAATRVGDIAHRWGFLHLSRFSNDYGRFFGELPSQTLGKG